MGKAWNKGLNKLTDKRVAKYSKTLVNKYADGSFTGHTGFIQPDKAKEKQRLASRGNKNNLGKVRSLDTKKKMSKSHKGISSPIKGKNLSAEHARNIKIAINRPEVVAKKRIAMIEYLQLKGIVYPNFNLAGCEYFKKFDEEHNTRGEYATNGGEHLIKELGYWVDYFNSDLRLIMEWDEPRHYYADGSLRKKDIVRQQNIEKFLADYKFIRIRGDL